MWGTIIGLAGTAVSGLLSALNNRKIAREQDNETKRQQAEYTRRMNENPLERSENAHLLGALDRKSKEQMQTNAAKNKIVGGTPEMEVAQQKAQADAYANAVGQIASGESTRRDDLADKLETSRQKASENRVAQMQKRGETYANLAANAANAAKGFLGGGDKYVRNPDGRLLPRIVKENGNIHEAILGTDGYGYTV